MKRYALFMFFLVVMSGSLHASERGEQKTGVIQDVAEWEYDSEVRKIQWAPDGKHIASEGETIQIRTFPGQKRTELGQDGFVYEFGWSPDGSLFAFHYNPNDIRETPYRAQVYTCNGEPHAEWCIGGGGG